MTEFKARRDPIAAMRDRGLADTNTYLVNGLAGIYAVAAVAGALFLDAGAGRTPLWIAFLAGGAALMLIGKHRVRTPRLSAVLVSAGAIAGGVPLLWTVVVPFAVAAVIGSSFALAARLSAQKT